MAITDIMFDPDGSGDNDVLEVTVTLTNDLNQGLEGLPAANIRFIVVQLTPGSNGGASEWQSYISRDSAGIPNAQATTETATAGTYTDNRDGTYTYRFSQGLGDYTAAPAFDATKIHRLGIEIRTNSGGFLPNNIPANNAPYDFVPDGSPVDPDQHRLIVNNATCNACHDNLELHGEARFDVEYCVTCHNPSSIDGDTVDEPWAGTVDMMAMTHKIHYGENLANGYFIFGFRGTLHDYSDIVFSQDVRNCDTCHNDPDGSKPQADNWKTTITRAACGSCHDDIDWDAGGHPGGAVFPDDSQCADCHGPDSEITDGEGRLVTVEERHRIFTAEASGDFQYNILDVFNMAPGQSPTINFSVTNPNDGSAYNIQTDPAFTTCAFGASRLAIGIAWSTSDFTNTDSGSNPAQPINMNPLTACGGTSTDEGNGVFSVTTPEPLPATVSGTVAVTIDGHPAVQVGDSTERIAVTNAFQYVAVTDDEPVPRRNAVAIDKCNDCHNQLAMHGNNRTDSIEVCATCHNPNATDARQRNPVAEPNDPPTDCVNVLGDDDVTVDMKTMIHLIHAAGATGEAYEVCGFRNSVHVYDFAYPGRLNNCEGCHEPGGYYPVDPTEVLATTIDVGDDPTPIDDVAISPNSAVCSTCHVSDLAKTHMEQNGGDFAAGKNADSSIVSDGSETCQLCHGPGRSSDVEVVHGIGEFQFN